MSAPSYRIETFNGLRVLFVMATDQEYGPHLQRLLRPLITGVGPVEAAVGAAATLAVLAAEKSLPDLVFSLGSAGSRTLEHACVYQLKSVEYRDMDASALGVPKGVTPFLDAPAVIDIPHHMPGVLSASISTGGAVISGAAYDAIAADMVDMESFAVLRAAALFDRPMIGLRGITDGRDDLTGLSDWTDYLHVVDEKLAATLEIFAVQVATGDFSLEP